MTDDLQRKPMCLGHLLAVGNTAKILMSFCSTSSYSSSMDVDGPPKSLIREA